MQMTSAAEPDTLQGLSESEAQLRHQRGQGNNVNFSPSRSYMQIVRANLVTFLNMVLFGIGVVLVFLGLYTDAFLSVGIAFWNVIIGMVQEIRAKRALDQIALLTRPRATVIRDGQRRILDPSQIVLGDILYVSAGDQIVVDGQMISSGSMDVDESLLTGESDLIPKHAGDSVYSGTFCVNGSGYYEARKVGAESVASKLTAGARVYRTEKTPLQVNVDYIVRLLVVLATLIGILFGLSAIILNQPLTESARVIAVVTGLIPNGLFFMTSIAYAMGAVRMAGQGALIQHANAVESMSNVNILCLDKTGTLTANHIQLIQTVPYALPDAELRRILGHFAATSTTANRTLEALQQAIPAPKLAALEDVPFSSARKWSAICFDSPQLSGTYVLGAPEILRPFLADGIAWGEEVNHWEDQGLRVLVFARTGQPAPLYDSTGQPRLPSGLVALGSLAFSDELRPEAQSALAGFASSGIRLKIISGDNPYTVAALARQAGWQDDLPIVSGSDLEGLTDAQFAEAAEEATIFGRITPQQKERIVDALRARGHYVAMIGDGVNDVLSLKKAQIGIAMQSGSQATRSVADIVLLNDSFAALPQAFSEGQRIVTGMVDIIRLFLARVVYQTLIIIGIAIIGLGFPITPVHMSLLSLLTVGLPTLALAAWARPSAPPRRLLREVLRFVGPAGLSLALFGAAIYVLYYVTAFHTATGSFVLSVDHLTLSEFAALEVLHTIPLTELFTQAHTAAADLARTVLTTLTTLAGLVLIVFVEPPTPFWVGGDEYSGDWRPTIFAFTLALLFVVIMALPPLREFFELIELQLEHWLVITITVTLWTFLLRYIWRARIFERFMRMSV